MEYKSAPAYLTLVDDVEGKVSGFVSIFGNVDDGGDRILRGAFNKSFKDRAGRIPMGWQHTLEHPLGMFTVLKEVDRTELPAIVLERAPDATGGVYFEGDVSLTPTNRERLQLMKDGAVPEWSIGYQSVDEFWTKENGQQVRNIKQLKFYEGSPVTIAMNPAAVLTSAKAAELKATGESQDYVRQRLQDALSDAFPYSSTGYDYYGCPMMQGDADGPGCCIRDIYPAAVIVFDRDFDALWEIAYSMEGNGNVTLGTRQLVKVVYVPVEAGSDEALETMNAKPVSSFKAGRRNSRPDESKLKDAHDALHEVLNMPHHDLEGKALDAEDATDGGSDDASESAKAMALLRKRLAIAQTPAALREVA